MKRIIVVIDTSTGEPLRAFMNEEDASAWEDDQWARDPQNFESQQYPVWLQETEED